MLSKQARELLKETKQVLDKRGWTRGKIEAPDGSVCLLGALGVAGMKMDMLVSSEAAKEASLQLARQIQKVVHAPKDGWFPGVEVVSIPYFNDSVAKSVDDVINLIDEVLYPDASENLSGEGQARSVILEAEAICALPEPERVSG